MIKVPMHDGKEIDVFIQGKGPHLLLPVNPIPIEGKQAEESRKWGVDPALGKTLIGGLSDQYSVVAFDYEGHVLSHPKPDTLTPLNIAKDFLAIADAAGAVQFAYYGYSWLALSGLQLAVRTNRLSALIMGGFPPIDGPYEEMLQVTQATHTMAINNRDKSEQSQSQTLEEMDWSQVEVTMSVAQTKQFVTLYQHLQDFDDRTAQAKIDIPRLTFAGSLDRIEYGERWGGVLVDIVGPLTSHAQELNQIGWDVEILEGLDHTGAMQPANVLPLIRPWLDSKLLK